MASITQITAEEIERLQPNELVHLLRILLHAEARLHCVNRSGIHVPHQITVADGGNDGEWNAEIAPGTVTEWAEVFSILVAPVARSASGVAAAGARPEPFSAITVLLPAGT